MLFHVMTPVRRLAGLLLAVLAVPALSGCAAMGVPGMPGAQLFPVPRDGVSTSPDPTTQGVEILGSVASMDGYALSVPVGWSVADLSDVDAMDLTDQLSLVEPILGTIAQAGLTSNGSPHLSLVAVEDDSLFGDGYGPAVIVATMRTRGMDKTAARSLVSTLLSDADPVAGVGHSVAELPAGDAHRYEATVVAEGTGVPLRVVVHVFRTGGVAFAVATFAPDDRYDAAQPAFDAILKSLRFGV